MLSDQVDERLKELEREAESHKEALKKIKEEKACLTAFKRTEMRMNKKGGKP
jgi:hypothetical protein